MDTNKINQKVTNYFIGYSCSTLSNENFQFLHDVIFDNKIIKNNEHIDPKLYYYLAKYYEDLNTHNNYLNNKFYTMDKNAKQFYVLGTINGCNDCNIVLQHYLSYIKSILNTPKIVYCS